MCLANQSLPSFSRKPMISFIFPSLSPGWSFSSPNSNSYIFPLFNLPTRYKSLPLYPSLPLHPLITLRLPSVNGAPFPLDKHPYIPLSSFPFPSLSPLPASSLPLSLIKPLLTEMTPLTVVITDIGAL